MAKKLARAVSFFDNESGKFVKYLPGDEPTNAHAKLITNQAAWEQEPAPEEENGAQENDGTAPNFDRSALEEMGYQELLQLAKDKNIQFDGNPKKDQVVDALLEAQEE